MYLLVGIDTEGDNQWDAAARANQTVREHLRAAAAARALRAARRPADLRHHPSGRDQTHARPRCCGRCSRGGDCEIGAHHHAWETPPCTAEDVARHRVRVDAAARSVRATARQPDRSDHDAVGVRPVSYRSGRFGFSAEHVAVARAARLSGRIERRAALLRVAQGRTGVRRGAAPAVLPGLRQRDAAGHEQPAGSAGVGRAESPAAEVRCSTPTRARPRRTRRSACFARCGLVRMRWLRPSYSSLDGHDRARAGPGADGRAGAEPALPFERGDRRRQPVQPDAGGAGRVLRSARAVPRRCRERAWRPAGDVRRVPRRATATEGARRCESV